VQWAELAHPVVHAVVRGELADGVQVELRNFLDEVLRDDDLYIDLEPEAGVAVLTALSAPTGRPQIVAVQADATLRACVTRNITAADGGETATVLSDASGIAKIMTRAASQRVILHTGHAAAETIASRLTALQHHAVAVACIIDDATDLDALGDVFDSAGLLPLMLVSADDECELAAFDPNVGATYCFALSPSFVESLESGT
jgi:hypothetical protein